MSSYPRATRALIVLATLAVVAVPSLGRAAANGFGITTVGPKDGGGEPSITTGPEGDIYVSYPGRGMEFYRSEDQGATWIAGGVANTNSGDTSVNTDDSGAVYQSNLGTSFGPDIFQGEVYKSLDHGATWSATGTTSTAGVIPRSESTGNVFAVDRQWTDTYIPQGATTDTARVYIGYHDFALTQMWVNTSVDGGKTFGQAVPIITSPLAQASSACNTIPGGLKVAKSGPHAGRVFVSWLTGDAATNAGTGCNATQLNSMYRLWVAYSDNADSASPTWTDQLVYDAGPLHDMATCFADITLDNQGNPYVAFSSNTAGEWDTYVMASFDGGTTWNGKTDGTGTPFKASADTGTHFMPAIAAGAPGKVDVAYLGTSTQIGTLPFGKPAPGGGKGATWNLFVAQSVDLQSAAPTWTVTQVTADPMHNGDICTLGLFCSAGGSLGTNRSLLDFIDIAVDARGMAHVAYTDDAVKETSGIKVANQTSGVPVL